MKNNGVKIGIVLSILLIGVVYAAISTNLSVNGTAQIKGNSTNFEQNIIFASASTSTTGATATLSADKKSITFTTPEFSSVGSSAVLTYTIANNSNYNATIKPIDCTTNTTDANFSKYLGVQKSRTTDLTLSNASGSNVSAAETLTISLTKSYPDSTAKTITYKCSISAEAY